MVILAQKKTPSVNRGKVAAELTTKQSIWLPTRGGEVFVLFYLIIIQSFAVYVNSPSLEISSNKGP